MGICTYFSVLSANQSILLDLYVNHITSIMYIKSLDLVSCNGRFLENSQHCPENRDLIHEWRQFELNSNAVKHLDHCMVDDVRVRPIVSQNQGVGPNNLVVRESSVYAHVYYVFM